MLLVGELTELAGMIFRYLALFLLFGCFGQQL
jgi:hypothetical protein